MPVAEPELDFALDRLPVVRAPVADLHENPENPRQITDPRYDALKRSLVEDPMMLAARPLIALPDGTVIAGNMRLRAAIDLGWEAVPTVYVDLDPQTARLWLLRDNNPYGEWLRDELGAMLAEIAAGGADLVLSGFDGSYLDDLLGDLAPGEPGAAGNGDALATFKATVGDPEHAVERGEVWRVGRHKLVCAGLMDGWPAWAPLLEPGTLFVPYPSPMLALTDRAERGDEVLLLLAPDPWLAGHVLDRYAEAREGDVERL